MLVKATTRICEPLSVISKPFDFRNPDFDTEEFTRKIAEIMVKENGVGLSAIQVGVPYRVLAIRTDPIVVAYNPKLVGATGQPILAEEGCLSFPGLYVKVKRIEEVRVRFQTHDGKFHTKNFAGMAARIIQHEMDHLDGVLFFNQASHFHRDRSVDKWERQMRKLNNAKG